jgi:hypothetical protein
MKAWFRKSPAVSGSFGTREVSRSADFSGDIRVFAVTSNTTVLDCEKEKSQKRQQSITHGKQATTNVTNAMNSAEYLISMELRVDAATTGPINTSAA